MQPTRCCVGALKMDMLKLISYEARNKQQPTGGMYEGSHESGIPGHQRRDKAICLCPV